MFEYVPKKEYQPIRLEVEKVILGVQKELRTSNGIKFQYNLIGSAGKRNLITRVKNGNQGYDFDYNFDIQKVNENYDDPKIIKQIFMKAFNKYFGPGYENAEDSTSVFTIKLVDKAKSKIIHSFDFAIVNNCEDEDGNARQEYIRFDKNIIGYSWALRPLKKDYSYLESEIKINGLWNELRELYLVNKNKEPTKKSRIVYYQTLEAIFDKNFQ